LEASALTHASRRGLLARKSPLLKLQGDEKLIAMARSGNPGAFETIVDRYQGRLLGFCRQMLGSTEDAEDVLQEVFVNAYRAMLADEREINLRPWLYRIARNRCLNHLRRPSADAQESMDMVPEVEAASTAEKVHNREEFRQILSDVNKLPETQRSALLLREMDALSYEEIADAMETTVPSVKSLLVRARISLAEASQARLLTCGEVRVELSEAAEGLRKVSAPVRRHVRECEECADFRSQVRSNEKLLAALFPVPALLAFKGFIASKLGLGGGSAASGAAGGAAAGGGAAAAGGAAGSIGAALGGTGAAGGLGGLGGAIGGAIGTKAVAGVVTAAVLTAGAAVELPKEHHPATPAAIVKHEPAPAAEPPASSGIETAVAAAPVAASGKSAIAGNTVALGPTKAEEAEEAVAVAPPEEVTPAPVEEETLPPGEAQPVEEAEAGASDTETSTLSGGVEVEAATAASPTVTAGAHVGKPTVTVTVAPETPVTTPPPATAAETTPPPAESTPPAEPEAAAPAPEPAPETEPEAEEAL
jgi:RNA polymerase sigma factor (sigma-70 family)